MPPPKEDPSSESSAPLPTMQRVAKAWKARPSLNYSSGSEGSEKDHPTRGLRTKRTGKLTVHLDSKKDTQLTRTFTDLSIGPESISPKNLSISPESDPSMISSPKKRAEKWLKETEELVAESQGRQRSHSHDSGSAGLPPGSRARAARSRRCPSSWGSRGRWAR